MTSIARKILIRRFAQIANHCDNILYHLQLIREVYQDDRYKEYREKVDQLAYVMMEFREAIMKFRERV